MLPVSAVLRHKDNHDVPSDDPGLPDGERCPVPLKYLDVMRVTKTDITEAAESRIEDFWTQHDPANDRPLSLDWVGTTTFNLLRPKPDEGYEWVEGRLTKIQKTTRPANIWPEIYFFEAACSNTCYFRQSCAKCAFLKQLGNNTSFHQSCLKNMHV